MHRAAAGTLLFGYGAIVLLVSLWPTPMDRGYLPTINSALRFLHARGLPEAFDYTLLEFSANIAFYVPIGFLVAFLLSSRFAWVALLVCPLLSVSLESVQGAVVDDRFATLSDVIANLLGALLGWLVAALLRHLAHWRDRHLLARSMGPRATERLHPASAGAPPAESRL